MNDLAPKRAKWYKQFLKTVSTTGFNVTGDMKRVIKKSELPDRAQTQGQGRLVSSDPDMSDPG